MQKKQELRGQEARTAHNSSRKLVYDYLQAQMQNGVLLPGSVLDLKGISQKLGISNTPLRDSLIQLEAEGYITIYPRSKVVVNLLEFNDFPYLYGIIGTIEALLITSALDKYDADVIREMRELNENMRQCVEAGEILLYSKYHYQFHDVFLRLNPNLLAERVIRPIKNRLWDFPRKNFIIEWYKAAVDEHECIIEAIARNDVDEICRVVKDVHWGIAHNKSYILKEYNLEES
ncbi:GntR family transcriptional regulator [uncultured Desulfovibrio sp.]|uniref:GntR family transcriptional regulator n=1 Tax=Candidatus Desulfovibrio intestinavium TaxID=2838534 RepID=A0A9D2HKE1_9BACT|nr:GntR family transcriptional regulator [uncultured Desulfovibrio sp.]HJA78341.1 GntR family transcriptional regulator [Candidatus Desulfovibrio intestinavium]